MHFSTFMNFARHETKFTYHKLFTKKYLQVKEEEIFIYSETNSTRATQPFLANHKTSSEQKNWTSFISGPITVRDKFNCSFMNSNSFVLSLSCDWLKNVGWPWKINGSIFL